MSGLVIDSSGWLEYFTGGARAKAFLRHIRSHKPIWTPSLVIYEVYKRIRREKSDAEALLAITQIEGQSKAIVPLDENLALFAADVSLRWKLAMADAIIYATALMKDSVVVTSDAHFEGLEKAIVVV